MACESWPSDDSVPLSTATLPQIEKEEKEESEPCADATAEVMFSNLQPSHHNQEKLP
jgi:hypothetical protein